MEKKEQKDVQIENVTDQKPKQAWHCDTYCRKIRHVTCEGQEHIDPNAPDPCPYLDEMLY